MVMEYSVLITGAASLVIRDGQSGWLLTAHREPDYPSKADLGRTETYARFRRKVVACETVAPRKCWDSRPLIQTTCV